MNCFKEYIKYVTLNVLGMIGLSCYILADTFFVAQGLGSNGLAALNLAIPIYSFIHGTGLMLGIGGAARYSMQLGRGNQEKQNRIFSYTILLGFCFAVLFILAGLFCSDFITDLLGAEEHIFTMTKTYLKVLFLFSPAFLLNDMILCFVRNDGAPQLSMTAMLAGSFSNILLDCVFIFVFDMGIFGAVFATSLAPMISLAVLSRFFLQKRNNFHFMWKSRRFCNRYVFRSASMEDRVFAQVSVSSVPGAYAEFHCSSKNHRISWQLIRYIFAGGIPSLVAEVSSGIVIIIFNIIMLKLRGTIGVAAYGVVANLSLVVIAVYTGMAQGIQPLVSRYYGFGDRERMQKMFRYAVWTVVTVSAVIYAGMYFGADQIASIFNSEQNAQMQQEAVNGIRLYFTASLFAGFNIVLSIYFAGTSLVREASIVSLLRGFILIIPVTFLMAEMWGVNGLWMSFPAAELITAAVGAYLLCREAGAKKVGA